MFFLPVIYYGLVLAVLVLAVMALRGSRRALWSTAAISYVVSFLGAFSIGLYTLVVTFVLVSIGAAQLVGWLGRPAHVAVAGTLGVGLWALAVRNIDDYWLFLPFMVFGRFL